MAARGFLSHTKFRGQADAPPPAVSFLYYIKVNFLVKQNKNAEMKNGLT
jgi:hypothetical protein